MNLLKAALYDPAVAVSKATSALLAMTAFDTTNLRLAVTVPAHGMVRFRLRCNLTGATTSPTILLGVLNGATVVGRVIPTYENATANAATQSFVMDAEFTATGLVAGATNFDAAYAVQVLVAATNIKYGGPNTNAGANAWGAFVFEAWDPQPQTTTGQLAVDANGRVDVSKVAGTAQTARDLGLQLDATVSSRSTYAGGAVASVTAAVTLPAIPANWITAAGITAAALNGKGDWSTYAGGDTAGTTTLLGAPHRRTRHQPRQPRRCRVVALDLRRG
jgi:ribosomal protein L18